MERLRIFVLLQEQQEAGRYEHIWYRNEVGGQSVEEYAIELRGVTKTFGEVVANDNVNLTLKKGEILSILGENGSGKTTLMNMLSGIYFPDKGEILVNGVPVTIRSPRDAFDLKIGMIHQHFKLIPIFTATENIILGQKEQGRLNMDKKNREIKELADTYGFDLEPQKKIYDMTVSQKQTVEIIKVLYRGADILILDEPTAVLTPQETEKLFVILRNMKKAGKSIIIITHKLNEVLEISDRVAVLRKGKDIGTIDTKDATVESLTEMMVGQKVDLHIERDQPEKPKEKLAVSDVSVYDREGVEVVKHVSFHAKSGEILGIAGVSGSGQKELLEAISGLQTVANGTITYVDATGKETVISNMDVETRRRQNIKLSFAFVPEDRLGMGLVGSMDLIDNMLLRSYDKGKGVVADRKAPKELAEKIVKDLDVVTPSVHTPVSRLSGGNVQKVLVGREIAENPEVLVVSYPVRGLDINSSYAIYNLLNEQKRHGVAVICVIEDLDVLLELCDRILILHAGEVSGIVDARAVTKDELGLYMAGSRKDTEYYE